MRARSWDGHVGSRVEVRIDDLAAGGDGVGRVEGCAVFVPLSAPGDRLLCEVERVEPRRMHAVVASLLESGPARRVPRCAHFGACGGCAWQHVEAAEQRQAKGRIVRAALARLGGIELGSDVEVRAAAEFGWRARAELHVAPAEGGTVVLGFLRRASHDVEPVEECPVLVPALQAVLDEVRSGARRVPRGAARMHLAAGDEGVAVAFDDARGRPIGPEVRVVRTVGELRFEIGARTFFQGNAPLVPELVECALAGIEGGEALDLYCGAGLFALPLARRCERVLGVESEERAVELARVNAEANGIANARFECEDVARHLARARRALEPRVVVLDPPRRGAGPAVVDAIAELGPEEVRYVSCDPATLARDARRFAERGYVLDGLTAFDLFPQTAHVECVAMLRRGP